MRLCSALITLNDVEGPEQGRDGFTSGLSGLMLSVIMIVMIMDVSVISHRHCCNQVLFQALYM